MRARTAFLTLALLLAATALGAGCTERERANPFDPGNPTTGGRPADFVALAGDQRVTLRWKAVSAPGLVGYEVQRSLSPDAGFAVIHSVFPPAISQFTDYSLLNGTDHYYRIYYVFDRGRSPLFAGDMATPGPVTPWVTDFSVPVIERLSADGRHVVDHIEGAVVLSAGAVDVDPATGAVWICDPDFGRVTIFKPGDASITVALGNVLNPAAVAVDPVDHSAWVGDDGFDQLVHFADDGTLQSPPSVPFESPIGIAIDPADGSVWVCERTGSRVQHMSHTGTPLTSTFVVNPSRVALDAGTGEAWVTSASRGRIVRLSALGARSDSVSSLSGPLDIVVDAARGHVWVTDPSAGLVAALNRDGTTAFTVRGLAGAYGLALDAATGEAWVTAYDAGKVVRIAPDGSILRTLGGFASPYGIALDPGTGPVPRTPAAPLARGRARIARN